MKTERLFLILSIISILFLLILTDFQKPTEVGEIENIINRYPVRIGLVNQTVEIILFEQEINLEKGNIIEVYGTQENEHTIIANKIICLNC